MLRNTNSQLVQAPHFSHRHERGRGNLAGNNSSILSCISEESFLIISEILFQLTIEAG